MGPFWKTEAEWAEESTAETSTNAAEVDAVWAEAVEASFENGWVAMKP